MPLRCVPSNHGNQTSRCASKHNAPGIGQAEVAQQAAELPKGEKKKQFHRQRPFLRQPETRLLIRRRVKLKPNQVGHPVSREDHSTVGDGQQQDPREKRPSTERMTLEFLRHGHRRGAAVRSDCGWRMAAIPVLSPDAHLDMSFHARRKNRRHRIRKALRPRGFLEVRHHVSQFKGSKCHVSNGLKDIYVLMAQVEAEIDLHRSCVHGYAPRRALRKRPKTTDY